MMPVQVRTAFALQSEQRARLKQKMEQILGQEVTLTCTEDSSLLCGLVVQAGGRIWDFSAKEQLVQIQTLLTA